MACYVGSPNRVAMSKVRHVGAKAGHVGTEMGMLDKRRSCGDSRPRLSGRACSPRDPNRPRLALSNFLVKPPTTLVFAQVSESIVKIKVIIYLTNHRKYPIFTAWNANISNQRPCKRRCFSTLTLTMLWPI